MCAIWSIYPKQKWGERSSKEKSQFAVLKMAARILEPLLSRELGLAPATGQGHRKPLAHAVGLNNRIQCLQKSLRANFVLSA